MNKYLIFRIKPYNMGDTVAQINVTHMTKPQINKYWKSLEEKYSPEKFQSALVMTREVYVTYEKPLS